MYKLVSSSTRCCRLKWSVRGGIQLTNTLFSHAVSLVADVRNDPELCSGRNKPKLPLVCRISGMLQTTCPPTCPVVRLHVHLSRYFSHFVGPKLDALDRQNSGREDMGLTALLLFLV